MRRSFGPMGGGGGGGGLMNTVHRAVRASSGGHGSSQDPFHHSSSTPNHDHDNYISINSPTPRPSSSNNLSFSSNHHPSPFSSVNWPSSMSPMNIEEYDDFVFCTVPSMDEVHHAISSLQHVVDPSASSRESGWELDWIEPSISMLQSRGSQSVYEAFRLLQTETSVKRMVMSLSSDKSVWDAVMNNEAVRELRDSMYQANRSVSGRSGEVESSDGSILVSDILQWILINMKAKVMDLVWKTTEMVNKLFQAQRNEKANRDAAAAIEVEPFEKKLTSSFLLTVMVLLVVVVSRASRS